MSDILEVSSNQSLVYSSDSSISSSSNSNQRIGSSSSSDDNSISTCFFFNFSKLYLFFILTEQHFLSQSNWVGGGRCIPTTSQSNWVGGGC